MKCRDTLFTEEKAFQVLQTVYGTRGAAFPAGVTCLAEATEESGPGGCQKISLAKGSVVRFQMVRIENRFLGQVRYNLRVIRPCNEACGDGETRCGASTLCVHSGADFCMLCEGKDEVSCVCRDGCKQAANGKHCSASTSPDTVISGTCYSGTCMAD